MPYPALLKKCLEHNKMTLRELLALGEKDAIALPKCGAATWELAMQNAEVIIYTRHGVDLIDVLIQRGVITAQTSHLWIARADSAPHPKTHVAGRKLIGEDLPLELAAAAVAAAEIEFRTPHELVNRSLNISQMRQYWRGARSYRVEAL